MATKKKATKKPSKKTTKKVVTKKKKVTTKSDNNQISKKKAKKSTGIKGQNGGKRKGSGRKKGAATTKTREIADKLADEGGLTPLEYMLGVLRETPESLKKQYDDGDIDLAMYTIKLEQMVRRKDNAAQQAAPYIHPRLSSVVAKVRTADNHEEWLTMMEDEK